MPFPSDKGFLKFFWRKRDEDMSRLPEIRRGPRTGESRFGPTMQTHTGTHLTATEGANLRIYRHVVVEARNASTMERGSESGFKIVNGYIESDEETRRIRALAVPVYPEFPRRAASPTCSTPPLSPLKMTLRMMTATCTRQRPWSSTSPGGGSGLPVVVPLDSRRPRRCPLRNRLDSPLLAGSIE